MTDDEYDKYDNRWMAFDYLHETFSNKYLTLLKDKNKHKDREKYSNQLLKIEASSNKVYERFEKFFNNDPYSPPVKK